MLPSLISWPDLPTPLGQLCFGGELRGTGGTGFDAPRRFGMHALVLLCAGKGRYVDTLGRDEPLHVGDIVLVSPHAPHRYGPAAGECWHELYICFRGEALTARLAVLDLPSIVRTGRKDGWRLRFEQILKHRMTDQATAMSGLSLLHVLLSDIASVARRNVTPVWLARAEMLLSAEHGQTSLTEIAHGCGLSYSTFRRRFAAETGVTPGRYRLHRQLDAASMLLRDMSLTIGAVAERCGFWDAAHLSHRFRQRFGASPRAWRMALRQHEPDDRPGESGTGKALADHVPVDPMPRVSERSGAITSLSRPLLS